MKMNYKFDAAGILHDITLTGLQGCERITSPKEALHLFQIENPAIDFTENVKAGIYNEFTDDEYRFVLASMKIMSRVWRQTEDMHSDERDTLYSMNIMTLFVNAMIQISRLASENMKLQEQLDPFI